MGSPAAEQSVAIDGSCQWYFYVIVNAPGPGTVTFAGTAAIEMIDWQAGNGPSRVFVNIAGLGDCTAYPVTAMIQTGGVVDLDWRYQTVSAIGSAYLPTAGTYFFYLNAMAQFSDVSNDTAWFEWGCIIATFYPS